VGGEVWGETPEIGIGRKGGGERGEAWALVPGLQALLPVPGCLWELQGSQYLVVFGSYRVPVPGCLWELQGPSPLVVFGSYRVPVPGCLWELQGPSTWLLFGSYRGPSTWLSLGATGSQGPGCLGSCRVPSYLVVFGAATGSQYLVVFSGATGSQSLVVFGSPVSCGGKRAPPSRARSRRPECCLALPSPCRRPPSAQICRQRSPEEREERNDFYTCTDILYIETVCIWDSGRAGRASARRKVRAALLRPNLRPKKPKGKRERRKIMYIYVLSVQGSVRRQAVLVQLFLHPERSCLSSYGGQPSGLQARPRQILAQVSAVLLVHPYTWRQALSASGKLHVQPTARQFWPRNNAPILRGQESSRQLPELGQVGLWAGGACLHGHRAP